MSDILQRILARKADEVRERRARVAPEALRRQIGNSPPVRGFAAALRARIGVSRSPYSGPK